MTFQSTIDDFRKVDAARADYPGEHLAVLGAGVLLLLAAGRSRSLLARIAVGAAGGALIGRAASGTGGIARLAGALQAGGWPWLRRGEDGLTGPLGLGGRRSIGHRASGWHSWRCSCSMRPSRGWYGKARHARRFRRASRLRSSSRP